MAAVTPSSPNVEWTWPQRTPIRTDSRGASPPLELQLLPPTSFPASESPWGLDPLRLQQLMMGSAAPGFSSANAPSACSSVRDLGALFDDNGASQPLPSGWERCLDLQSGEVFLKKSDGAARVPKTRGSSHGEQHHGNGRKEIRAENGGWSEVHKAAEEHRQDWSNRWPGEMASRLRHGGTVAHASEIPIRAHASLGEDRDAHGAPDGEVLCLDLDLRLANKKRCRASTTEDRGAAPPPSHAPNSAAAGKNQGYAQESVGSWAWERCGNGGERPARILDMARESTMATAVCSKCLMYVLLRKSCPVCPRCSVPIALDGAAMASSPGRKRSRLELSWDALSLSTSSSR